MTKGTKILKHGRSMYNLHKCRCVICVDANRKYAREFLRKRKALGIVDGHGKLIKSCPKQQEINRLRTVLHSIANSRPDEHMDIEKNPELVEWICNTCHKASVGAYPGNKISGM